MSEFKQTQNHENQQKSFWGFFVYNWRIAILTIILIVVGGLIALVSMPLESDPEVQIPIGIVTVPYPGASSADVEKLVTDTLEDKLKNLDDLKNMTSTSSEGMASIVVEFDATADLQDSLRKLRDEIDVAKLDLPENAKDPIITEIRAGDLPIITFSLLGDFGESEFQAHGEALQEQLESIKGVSQVDLLGVSEKEIQILLDIQAIEGYGLSLSQIVAAIQADHLDLPIGRVLTDNFYYQVSLKGQLDLAEDLLSLPIVNLAGQNIYLRDLAEVREIFSATRSKARIYLPDSDSYLDSVTLQVSKKTGANITEIADQARDIVATYQRDFLPPGAMILTTNDNSKFIRSDIRILGRNGIQTIIIIFILLYLALGWREALLAGLTIPLIFLSSFLFLFLIGETFNGLVLFALILSLGLIVDTAIVMMEGVHENIKIRKLPTRAAVMAAIRTYKAPLISGTLTTISAFIPLMLMSGVMGEFVRHIPITISITLLSSLLIAIMLLSAIAARVFHNYQSEDQHRELWFERVMPRLKSWYLYQLRQILGSRSRRWIWITGMIVAFLITLTFPFVGVLKIQMFPTIDTGYFVINVEAPLGLRLKETEKIVQDIEAKIEDLPELVNFVTVLGGGALGITGGFGDSSGDTSQSQASITVNLSEKETRSLRSQQIAALARQKLRGITAARITVEEVQAGPPSGAPIEIRVIGDDISDLEAFARVVETELLQIEGTREVSTDIAEGTGEFHLKPIRDRLEYYGISTRELALYLRSSVFGNDSVKVVRSGKETPIIVQLDFRSEDCLRDQFIQILEIRDQKTICRIYPQDISQIQGILIPTPRGQIPAGDLLDFELHPTVSAIRHRDTETVVNVKSFVEEGKLVSDITTQLRSRMDAITIPSQVRLEYGGETEDTTESFRSLAYAMVVGLLLIVFILVFQFNSFVQPFIIMFSVPLSLIGVFIGLALLGKNFSFPGFIGIVALSGIVVNDAIVLIDRINNNIRNRLPVLEAILEAGGARLQPIILTTITTAAGVLPLAFTSEIWGDLAWTVALGIVFATVLTLVMVPVFYLVFHEDQEIIAENIAN